MLLKQQGTKIRRNELLGLNKDFNNKELSIKAVLWITLLISLHPNTINFPGNEITIINAHVILNVTGICVLIVNWLAILNVYTFY